MANKIRDPKREAFWRRALARQRKGGKHLVPTNNSIRATPPPLYQESELQRINKSRCEAFQVMSYSTATGGIQTRVQSMAQFPPHG